ncbi:PAS sensor protein [Pseudopedobacter saltans DSM 12145]|uniref:PAS sensor protein n=1 Tax=Pseudopedobacter saltans (strain ATCC 51119 / DSM 12145 / JCM 21818 / CCUG 39354 / LMG 10337 / NBRC 100064 / NCIMB 13643) TaxID=762903 RepID=F0S4K9_PSESL|nr:PAS domain S-box protein [Pseudopedobacter saltans]ADY52000.1 PAS sensor protein [Pseudopedobacter saltans DSM 12145]
MIESDFYYSLLDKLSIVAITDRQGKIVYANDKFCDISKYSREELLGSTHKIVNSGYHSRSFFIDLWKTIIAGEIWRGEIRNKAKDGSYYWVDTFIVPEMDEDNKVRHYYSIRIDITKRKLQEFELLKRKVELEEIALMQSHQVRKPVANLLGLIDLFEKQELNDLNKTLYQMMKQSIMELEDSIKDIVEKAE